MSSDHDDLCERLATYDADARGTTDEARQARLTAARAFCQRLEKPMESLLRLAWIEPAYTACLKIGVDVGLFEALGRSDVGESYGLDELAKRTKTDDVLLERILRLLASMDTVTQLEDGSFCATALSSALMTRPCSATVDYRYLISNPLFQHLPALLASTRYKSPCHLLNASWQRALDTKLSFFDWLGRDAEALEVFTSHMAGYTSQRGTWEDLYPVRDRLLQDAASLGEMKDLVLVYLGGGAGHDLKRFASSFVPTTKRSCLVLQDLREKSLTRLTGNVVACLLPSPPYPSISPKSRPCSGARGYYMHSVLHDWPDDSVRTILKQMHPTLSQKTADGHQPKLLLNENVLLKRGVQPQPAALDLIMMAAFGSCERSEEQWRALLESAGYRVTGIFSKRGIDEAVIEAEAIHAE